MHWLFTKCWKFTRHLLSRANVKRLAVFLPCLFVSKKLGELFQTPRRKRTRSKNGAISNEVSKAERLH